MKEVKKLILKLIALIAVLIMGTLSIYLGQIFDEPWVFGFLAGLLFNVIFLSIAKGGC